MNRPPAKSLQDLARIARASLGNDGDDPVQFSLSANLHRRHLNQGQKAMVALKVEELFAAEAKKRMAAMQAVMKDSAEEASE